VTSLALLLAMTVGVAQPPAPATDSASAATVPAQPADPPQVPAVYRVTGSRIGIGRDIHVPRDEEVADAVVVVGGSARIDGRVREGIIVVGGNLHLGPAADVRGDVALVGGEITREAGARLLGSVSYVSIGSWPDLGNVFGWWGALSLGEIGRWLGLVATVVRVSILATLVVLILLVARAPVARVGRAAAAEPFRAAVVGLAAEVLFLPMLLIVSIALGITIIGLPIVALLVPVAVILAFAGLLLGFTALACRVGEWVEDRLGWRPRSAFLAAAVGMALIVGPTLLARTLDVAPGPLHAAAFSLLVAGAVAEFVVWTIGLGATLMTGFGRWHTAPPPIESQPPALS
jgi:hypothetical protein